jgi:hypothetical protein
MSKDIKKLLDNHKDLIHSDELKVVSHVQRKEDDWYINTIMIENIDAPFKYKRKQPYQSLIGSRINLTYYRQVQQIAGMEFEFMKVVRLKQS